MSTTSDQHGPGLDIHMAQFTCSPLHRRHIIPQDSGSLRIVGPDPFCRREREILSIQISIIEYLIFTGHGDCVQLLEEACPDASLCTNEMSIKY